MSANDLLLATMGGRTEAHRGDYSGELFEESQKANAAAPAGSGGGGGDGGGGGAPAFGYKKVWLLPETEVTFTPNEEMGGMCVAMLPYPEGLDNYGCEKIVVVYNGVEHEYLYRFATLGNPAAMGGEDNGDPFIIMFGDGTGVMVALDGATSATVGVYAHMPETVEHEFAPFVDTVNLIELGAPTLDEANTWKFGVPFEEGARIVKGLRKDGINLRMKLTMHRYALANSTDYSKELYTENDCTTRFHPEGVYNNDDVNPTSMQYVTGYAFVGNRIISLMCTPPDTASTTGETSLEIRVYSFAVTGI